MKVKEQEPKKQTLFPIWCPTEDQKNKLKSLLEELRKQYRMSNYKLLIYCLNSTLKKEPGSNETKNN